jgi:hypothetical protein
MAWSTEFEELMPHTLTMSTWVSANGYGEPTYSTASITYIARAEDTNRRVTGLDGYDTFATTEVIVASTTPLPETARYTLSHTTDSLNLVRIERFPDEDGLHHQVLYFGPVGGG